MLDILIPFASIALAEFGDKTMLAVLLLASKTKRHFALFLGVMTGFFLVDGFAIFLGSFAGQMIPVKALRILSGVLFITFGILTLKQGSNDETAEKETKEIHPFWMGFTAIFLGEWGDKTQLAAGVFATRYAPAAVLAGCLLGLGLLSTLSIYAGKWLGRRIEQKLLKSLAGILFLLMGLFFLLS